MKLTHQDFHYSVTLETSDEALLSALRGVSFYSERSSLKWLASGGTGREEWRQNEGMATMHFSNPDFRSEFLSDSKRLLGEAGWRVIAMSDTDSAKKASEGPKVRREPKPRNRPLVEL